MEKRQKTKFKKIVLLFICGFVGLFVFRLVSNDNPTDRLDEHRYYLDAIDNEINLPSLRNFAIVKHKATNQPNGTNIDQKYEKIANIQAISSAFDNDEKNVRDQVKALNGLIQFEDKTGNIGHRSMHLTIGVPPEHFDQLFKKLIEIGEIQEKRITKKDKTNEYNELQAKKTSLEKIRHSLIELKSKNGKINEYMLLENRILEIDQQLQELGVSLGDFDAENQFCTIKFALKEHKTIQLGFMHRLISALEWTIITYLKLMGILCLITLSAYLIILSIEKAKNIYN